jgi:hypothetical protein
VVLSSILRKYEFRTEVAREEFDDNLKPELVLRPGNGVQIYLRKRKDVIS